MNDEYILTRIKELERLAVPKAGLKGENWISILLETVLHGHYTNVVALLSIIGCVVVLAVELLT